MGRVCLANAFLKFNLNSANSTISKESASYGYKARSVNSDPVERVGGVRVTKTADLESIIDYVLKQIRRPGSSTSILQFSVAHLLSAAKY